MIKLLATTLLSGTVLAASFSASPVIVDIKAGTREIVRDFVELSNFTGRKIGLYASVFNVSAQDGGKNFQIPSEADLSSSLANWVRISRGVIELMPGEKRSVSFEIEVNYNAKPGIYHAAIVFSEGPTRAAAEKTAGQTISVNLEVLDDAKEYLQLKKFAPDKIFFSGFPVSFTYEVENAGNRILSPLGEIRIYNRRGREIGAVKTGADDRPINPDQKTQLAALWDGSGGFGRYKAILDLDYGERGRVQDTVFFWVVPWPMILAIIITFVVACVLIIRFINKYHEKIDNQ